MKMTYKALECRIGASKDLRVAIGDCCPEAVAYAACRLFAHSGSLCRKYVTMSYAMRLARGKERRSRRYRCVVPATLAELEGELLRIDFAVSCDGVTILSVIPECFRSDG